MKFCTYRETIRALHPDGAQSEVLHLTKSVRNVFKNELERYKATRDYCWRWNGRSRARARTKGFSEGRPFYLFEKGSIYKALYLPVFGWKSPVLVYFVVFREVSGRLSWHLCFSSATSPMKTVNTRKRQLKLTTLFLRALRTEPGPNLTPIIVRECDTGDEL